MEEEAKKLLDQYLEFSEFVARLKETGIGKYLSDTAIMLMFLALGKEMWRKEVLECQIKSQKRRNPSQKKSSKRKAATR